MIEQNKFNKWKVKERIKCEECSEDIENCICEREEPSIRQCEVEG